MRRRGDYLACLTNWLACFPRDHVFTTFLEDVVQNPKAVLDDAFLFLGVDPRAAPDSDLSQQVHGTDNSPVPDWAREYLTEALRVQDGPLADLLGRPLPWSERR